MERAKTSEMPSQEFLNACFDYDPITGFVTWKDRPKSHFNGAGHAIFKKKCVGKRVGTFRNGYLILGLSNQRGGRSTYMLHRLIYKMMLGNDPEFIDHINGMRDDNRWDNLRSVTIAENNRNCRIKNNNTTGHTGVYFSEQSGNFISAIIYNGIKIHLGSFDDVATAGAAYRGAAAAISAITETKFLTDRSRKIIPVATVLAA